MDIWIYLLRIRTSALFILCVPYVTSKGSDGDEGEEPDLIPHGYNRRETGQHKNAIDVKLTIWVESIIRIDLSAMEFIAQCYMNHEWQDIRLKRSGHHTVIMNDPTLIWTPDTYCVNCREERKQEDRALINIDVEGRVYYSQLALLYVSCIMNLEDFPFDFQTCTIKLASYSLNNSFMTLRWDRGLMVNEIILDQFTVSKTTKMKQYSVTYLQGNFTILEGELFFTRQIGYYIIQFFVPSSCLVFLSWITFYMCTDDVSNRIGIGVTLILTMIFLLGYVNATLPKVSYIKAIDWYVIISLAMIILSVLESVLVYWILNSDGSSRPMHKSRHDILGGDMNHHHGRRKILNNGQYNGHGVQLELIQRKKHHHKKKSKQFTNFEDYRDKTRERMRKSKIVDIVARVIFPLAFISFNIYFVLIHSD